MQKLNEGHLQVALHPTVLLLLHFLLLLQLPLLLLLPAAATKIRKRIKRIRENSSTISHLFVSSSSSRDGSSPGGWLGWVAWWAWSTGIKCQLEFQVRSPLGRVQPWPTPKASNTPPPVDLLLLLLVLRIFIPFTSLNFSQTQIVYRLQGTLLTLRPDEPESCALFSPDLRVSGLDFRFSCVSSVRFALLLYPALCN